MPDTDTIISSDRTKEIDSAKNFGGLVGMVKSTKTGGDVDIMVKGKHRFAFTVNTILNSGYADGATQTSTKLAADSSSVTLLAQSYYINQDDFNISATSDETWYNADAKNPLNSQTIGWAKEYTGFRVVNRFIPAKDNGGEWDAHIPIYDAKDITAVGTVLNQNITTGSYMYEEKTDNPDDPVTLIGDEEDETGKAFADDPNKIIYTVYQREMSEAYLYCPIGIAKLAIFRDFDEDKQKLVTFGENGNIEKYEAYKAATQVNYVDVQKEVSKDKWEDRTKINFNLDGTGEKDHLKGKETVVLSNLKDLMFFNWEEHPLATFGHKEGDKQKYFIDLEKA